PGATKIYFVNQTPNLGGRALFRVELAGRNIESWPSCDPNVQPPNFTDTIVPGPDRAVGYTGNDNTLWDIVLDPFSAEVSSLDALFPADKVLAIAASNERPSARFLFVLLDNGNQTNLLRIDLSNNSTSSSSLAAF